MNCVDDCKYREMLDDANADLQELKAENAKLKNNNNYLHEMLSESRQANEHLHAELKRHKSILRMRPNAMTALYDENGKLRKLAVGMYGMLEMFDKMLGNHDTCETPRPLIFGEYKSFKDVMCELGIEVY